MQDSTPFDDANLGDDPELIAALAAAFGDEGAGMLSEVTKPDAIVALAADNQGDLDQTQPDSAASHTSLADLIGKLDQAMASVGGDQEQAAIVPDATDSAPTLQEDRYVVFQTGDQLAAIPLTGITEIDRLPNYTPLPRTPDWCLGVANLRGEIVSITDLAALIGEAGHATQGLKVMIIRSQKDAASTALVVDRVVGIRSFSEGTTKLPEDLKSPLAPFSTEIGSIDSEQVLLVDPDLLMQHPDMQPYMRG